MKTEGRWIGPGSTGRNWGMLRASEWLGVSLLEWNDAEHGRLNPGPLLSRVQRKALDDAMAPLRRDLDGDD